MNYIINPSWFYWIKVINTVRGILWGAWSLLLCAIIVAAIAEVVNKWRIDDTNEMYETVISEYRKHIKMWNRILVPAIAVFSVCTLTLIFLPAKDTMIEMMIAKYATYENAEWTVETVKSAVDYIAQSIAQIGG